MKRWLTAIVLVGVLLPASQASANVDLVDLEDEVMCVVCERPLSTSGGEAADDQRAVIQRLIDQGLTKEQIKDALVDEYGERVLVHDSSPLAVAIPVIAAIVGAGSIVVLLRRRRRSDDASEAPDGSGEAPSHSEQTSDAPAVSAADEARIDAELAER